MTPRPLPLVWITGAHGLIGNYLVRTAPQLAPGWRVRALTRAGLDLLDLAAVAHEFKQESPQLVIHCAAMTVVAEVQKNPDHARRVNCDVTRHLSSLAAESRLVFFSTDLVFDGRRGNYAETDAVNPLTLYGETKAVAEQLVLENPRHLVVRTSINGGVSAGGNRAFNEQLRLSLRAGGQGMTCFTDEFRCPIPAVETARAVWELALKNCAGLLHLAGAERLSRWQIAQALLSRWGQAADRIRPGLAKEFAGPPRALDTSLNLARIQPILSRPLPGLTEWLAANPCADF
jgi:dTDP-4-dehydrorhamnose reductase